MTESWFGPTRMLIRARAPISSGSQPGESGLKTLLGLGAARLGQGTLFRGISLNGDRRAAGNRSGEAIRNPLAALDSLNKPAPGISLAILLPSAISIRYAMIRASAGACAISRSGLRASPRTLVDHCTDWAVARELEECISPCSKNLPCHGGGRSETCIESIAQASGIRPPAENVPYRDRYVAFLQR